jgi:hypothetical protein
LNSSNIIYADFKLRGNVGIRYSLKKLYKDKRSVLQEYANPSYTIPNAYEILNERLLIEKNINTSPLYQTVKYYINLANAKKL